MKKVWLFVFVVFAVLVAALAIASSVSAQMTVNSPEGGSLITTYQYSPLLVTSDNSDSETGNQSTTITNNPPVIIDTASITATKDNNGFGNGPENVCLKTHGSKPCKDE